MKLLERTASLELYNLREGSMVFCELAAYQSALDLLEDRLCMLEDGISVARMRREQLERYCRMRGLSVPQEMGEAGLRQYASAAIQGCLGWTVAEMESYLCSLGALVTLVEQAEQKQVLVGGTALGGLCATSEEVQRVLDRLLPPGVEVAISLGTLTWALLDAAELSAQTLDQKDFTWAWFDLKGHELLRADKRRTD